MHLRKLRLIEIGVAMIDPRQRRSLAVARRYGFRQFGDSRYKDAPTTLWEHRFG